MSWSKSVGPNDGPGLVDEIQAIDITQGLGEDSIPEVEEQIAAAKKLAVNAVQSGAVGPFDDGTEFRVSLNGHANPKHNSHTEGASSYDGLGISIVQASSPVLPEEPVAEPSDEPGAEIEDEAQEPEGE